MELDVQNNNLNKILKLKKKKVRVKAWRVKEQKGKKKTDMH